MTQRFTAALVVVLALSFGACATAGSAAPVGAELRSDVQGSIDNVARFTADDLQTALADATAHGDVVGATCWTALLKHVGTGTVAQIPAIKGAASAFQRARDLRNGGGQSAVLQDINLGCAAMFVETKVTLAKLGLMATGAGGAMPALGALPGLLPALGR